MENRETPGVSVIMPAYNAARYIEESIRSVIGQTYRNWRLIVLDDCSSDETAEVVRKLMEEDDRICLVRNEENMGVAKTRNRGLDLCDGEYAALLDSDDVWHPEKLEKQVRLAQQTNAGIVYCSYGMTDENGVKVCDDFIVPEESTFDTFLTRSVISCSTAMLARGVYQKYRFDTAYYHEDLACWFRILRDGHRACGLPEVLAQYRVMQGTRASNKVKCAVYRWKIYRELLGFSPVKSMVLLYQYATQGIKKYRRSR